MDAKAQFMSTDESHGRSPSGTSSVVRSPRAVDPRLVTSSINFTDTRSASTKEKHQQHAQQPHTPLSPTGKGGGKQRRIQFVSGTGGGGGSGTASSAQKSVSSSYNPKSQSSIGFSGSSLLSPRGGSSSGSTKESALNDSSDVGAGASGETSGSGSGGFLKKLGRSLSMKTKSSKGSSGAKAMGASGNGLGSGGGSMTEKVRKVGSNEIRFDTKAMNELAEEEEELTEEQKTARSVPRRGDDHNDEDYEDELDALRDVRVNDEEGESGGGGADGRIVIGGERLSETGGGPNAKQQLQTSSIFRPNNQMFAVSKSVYNTQGAAGGAPGGGGIFGVAAEIRSQSMMESADFDDVDEGDDRYEDLSD